MARLNKKSVSTNAPNVINRAGGVAHSQSAELALASVLATSFFAGDKYYESNAARINRFLNLLTEVSPEFAAKAAIFIRDKYGMRTGSHLVARYLAKIPTSETFNKERFFDRVVFRPDDALEIAASILAEKDGKLPAALKRGFANALRRFDEYQLAKYRGEGKEVNIYDLINLVHPKETPAIRSIIKGTFTAPNTREVALTQAGQVNPELQGEEREAAVAANKKEAWKQLILERKIGYFALLRNLNNITDQADDEVIKAACELLVDEKLIRKSRVLPFRFITAMNALGVGRRNNAKNSVVIALSKAAEISLSNIPALPGKTLVAVDCSGSMTTPISDSGNRSSANPSCAKTAALFAAAFLKRNPDGVDVMSFSDSAVYPKVNPTDSLFSLADSIEKAKMGGTNVPSIFKTANKAYDRIIILSDFQSWQGGYYGHPGNEHKWYKSRYSCDPAIYSVDLVGYGDMSFPENKVTNIAGFSEKMFDLIDTLESGLSGLVEEIKKVEI